MTVFHPTVRPLGGVGGDKTTTSAKTHLLGAGAGAVQRSPKEKKTHSRHRLFIYLFSIWKRQLEPVVPERRAHRPPPPLSLPSASSLFEDEEEEDEEERGGGGLQGVSTGGRERNFHIPALLLIVS